MIVNLCNEHRDPLDDEYPPEQFFLSTFTIIFFDECHNTVKNSPYSNVMREYHYLKNMGNMPEGHSFPQIIGLTASLGTGDKKNCMQVRSYIAGLCANMDVKELSIVKDNLEELLDHNPFVTDQVSFCERSNDGPIEMFTKRLKQMMQEVEDLIRTTLKNEPTVKYEIPPTDKEHNRYENWISNQRNCVSLAGSRNKTLIIEVLDVLKDCFYALSYNINFNPEVALKKYLEKELGPERIRNFTDNMNLIWDNCHRELVGIGSAENPMIARTVQFILDQNEQTSDFRAIIFVRTKKEADFLNYVLNDRLHELGIKSDWMSGQKKSTASSADISASKQKQMEKLKMFADGENQILVSTSVAEEGLDIPECSLVIKYNYATNETAHVQRRGRARARNSKCVLITNSIALHVQESNNLAKENLMTETISLIQNSPGEFRQCVDEESNKVWPRIQREDTDKAQRIKEQINRNIVYKIVCMKCDTVLCTNKDIRSKNTQYIVCNPGFWSLVRRIPLPLEQRASNKFNSTGSIECLGERCGSKLGQLIDVNTVNLPCLKVKSILLLIESTNERILVKQWKNILDEHFTPTTLKQRDVQTMKDADYGRAPIEFEHHTANGEVINVIRQA